VQIPDSVSISALWNDYVRNSLRISPNFTRGSHVIDSTSNHKRDFRGVQIRIFAILGSSQHIFQRIGTKFPTELKLSNADFVSSRKWDRKYT